MDRHHTLQNLKIPYRKPIPININTILKEQIYKVYEERTYNAMKPHLTNWHKVRAFWEKSFYTVDHEYKGVIDMCKEVLGFLYKLTQSRSMFGKAEDFISVSYGWKDSLTNKTFTSYSIILERLSFLHNYACMIANYLSETPLSRGETIMYAQEAFSAYQNVSMEIELLPIQERDIFVDDRLHHYTFTMLIYSSVFSHIDKFLIGIDPVLASKQLSYGNQILLSLSNKMDKWPKQIVVATKENAAILLFEANECFHKSKIEPKPEDVREYRERKLDSVKILKQSATGNNKLLYSQQENELIKLNKKENSTNINTKNIPTEQVLDFGKRFIENSCSFVLPICDCAFTNKVYKMFKEKLVTINAQSIDMLAAMNLSDVAFIAKYQLQKTDIVEAMYICDIPENIKLKIEGFQGEGGMSLMVNRLKELQTLKSQLKASIESLLTKVPKNDFPLKGKELKTLDILLKSLELIESDFTVISSYISQNAGILDLIHNKRENLQKWMMCNSTLRAPEAAVKKCIQLYNTLKLLIEKRNLQKSALDEGKYWVVQIYNEHHQIIKNQEDLIKLVTTNVDGYLNKIKSDFDSSKIISEHMQFIEYFLKILEMNFRELAQRKLGKIETAFLSVETTKALIGRCFKTLNKVESKIRKVKKVIAKEIKGAKT